MYIYSILKSPIFLLDASEHMLLDDNYDEHIPALDEESLFSPVRYHSFLNSSWKIRRKREIFHFYESLKPHFLKQFA